MVSYCYFTGKLREIYLPRNPEINFAIAQNVLRAKLVEGARGEVNAAKKLLSCEIPWGFPGWLAGGYGHLGRVMTHNLPPHEK